MPTVSRGVEYLLLGVDAILGFPLFFIGFQIELSSLLRLETYFFKGFIRHFLEFRFKFVAFSVTFCSAVWCVSSLPG